MVDPSPHTSGNTPQESKEQKLANSKNKESGKKRNVYPIGTFLLENLKEKTCLKDLIRLYLRTHEYKPTDRAFQKAANELANEDQIELERREQLWLIPKQRDEANTNSNAPMLGRKIANRVHSTHKIKLSMTYKGDQPTDGIEHIFGRYRTAYQYIYHRGTSTIGAYKNKLVIWVRNPPGTTTPEQRTNAKAEGYKVLQNFAREKNLNLEGYLEKVDLSHHVVENDPLNNLLKTELLNKYGVNISARIGTQVCQTSHPGRVEHEGKARIDRIVRGDLVAEGLEFLTLDFQKKFEAQEEKVAMLEKVITEMIPTYHENLKLHTEVQQKQLKTQEETLKTQKEMQETLQAIRKEKKED